MNLIVVLLLFIIICLSLIIIFSQREVRHLNELLSDLSVRNSHSEAYLLGTHSSESPCAEKSSSDEPPSKEFSCLEKSSSDESPSDVPPCLEKSPSNEFSCSDEFPSEIYRKEDGADTSSYPSQEVVKNDVNQPTESIRDKELFERINQTIIEQQLFLDPGFSREKFIRLGLINKNKVGQLLQQYANTNLNGYINNLRLEYALKLIRTQPDIPVKAVAIDSGFNNARTFYRLFQAKYGKTPAEYKDSLHDRA